jgi:hypothetical protein
MSMSPLPSLIISGSAPDKSVDPTLSPYPPSITRRLNCLLKSVLDQWYIDHIISSSRIEVDTIGLPNCRTISNTISLFGTRIPTVVFF